MSGFLNARFRPLSAYTPGEQPKNMKDLIKLNTNENPYPPSPATIAAITDAVTGDMRLYNSVDALDLREAIAQSLGVGADNIILSNGSDEILYKIFLAYSDLGARFPDITYGFYRVWAQLTKTDFEEIPLKSDFSLDPADYAKNNRMTVFANPNAPTGMALKLDDIESILRANPDFPVVVDEAYVEFGGETAVGLIKSYGNLIVVRTFSKSMCMAGARLGYAVANRDIVEDLEKMKFSVNPYDVNTFTQKMGLAAINDIAYYRERAKEIASAREYAAKELKRLGFAVLDSKANFIFACPPDGDGAGWQAKMRERGILIRHFSLERIAPYCRVSIGTMEQMRVLIEKTREAYA